MLDDFNGAPKLQCAYSIKHMPSSVKHEAPYHERAATMVRQLMLMLPYEQPCDQSDMRVYAAIEAPTNWLSERGQRSRHRESVQKLYYFVGSLISALLHTHMWSTRDRLRLCEGVYVVGPYSWKGHAPKNIMVERAHYLCKSTLGCALAPGVPHDVCEAILLAARARSCFNRDSRKITKPFVLVDDIEAISCGNTRFELTDWKTPI